MNAGKTLKTDIVIIGAGGAGLAAAAQAAEKGAKVIVLEKRHAAGGNSAMATGFFGAESPTQKRMNIDAPRDELFKLAMEYTHWAINPRIMRAYVDISGDTVRWLEEKGLKIEFVTTLNPRHTIRTFHRILGATVIKILVKSCQELGVKLLYNSPVKTVTTDEKGKVSGVIAETEDGEIRINAKSIIITTGGYGANKRLLKKYCPTYTNDMIYLGLRELTGDGLIMATQLGAATESLGVLHYWGARYPGPRLVNLVNRQPEVVWVNKNGERYCDETVIFDMAYRGNVVDRQPGKISYTLFDEKMKRNMMSAGQMHPSIGANWNDLTDLSKGTASIADKFYGFQKSSIANWTDLPKQLQIEAAKGGVKIANTWDEIAKWMGVAPKVLNSTISEYNSFCKKGHDNIFVKDKEYLKPLSTPPYYAVKCYSHFPDTIGGIKVDPLMEVIDKQSNNPIPGLYAAGVCVGGWQSDTYCFILTGSMFGFALNSGRIAGESAANQVLKK
jgi:fumarate reductase flavoprotein subunit